MKYLKILAFAALAAMALMAVAASSASAAKVCSTAGTGAACGAGHGNVYTGPIVGKNVGNVILEVTNGSGSVINTVTCTESEAAGEVTNGETGAGKLTKQTFKSCTSNVCGTTTASTTASTTNPWASAVRTEIEGTENTNGIMTVEGVTGSFTCTFIGIPVTCKYKAAKAEVKVDGSDTEPKITASKVALELEEGGNETVCGKKGDWTGTYKITTPSSLFIE